MTSSLFPADGSRVELDNGGRELPDVRVVRVTETTVTLSLALSDVALTAGSVVTLRWPAGPRGRYSQTGTVLKVDENRIEITFLGEPEIEQLRNYVRGGGGESILLVRAGEPQRIGQVHDLSERSVRAHFSDVDLRPGEEMLLRLQLGDEVVEFPAIAYRVAQIRQQVPVRGPLVTEMVAIFEQDERQAKVIRRYVLRLQSQARREAVAADALAEEALAEAAASAAR
ncbi:hypothetical protein Ait01nite_018500 [Actinoplanes italicus]|uniref:PilZ domain-containing protein n=1 Tax=Actinoplanes italicus TaxID=113567 RepID=A0A2T0KPS4_9ACTN|nr:hypothetical protein [Actinoplanes italicus]PRX25744.1 hypothetical protein CLV67_101464 [Actinoplanes italicus]GIE28805.1 hypothetical protein Ait01nite_018500 [Actinoplanes italicus]